MEGRPSIRYGACRKASDSVLEPLDCSIDRRTLSHEARAYCGIIHPACPVVGDEGGQGNCDSAALRSTGGGKRVRYGSPLNERVEFKFRRSRGVVWVCDVAGSSSRLNSETGVENTEAFLPRLYWVATLAVESAGGRFIKWTGDW